MLCLPSRKGAGLPTTDARLERILERKNKMTDDTLVDITSYRCLFNCLNIFNIHRIFLKLAALHYMHVSSSAIELGKWLILLSSK